MAELKNIIEVLKPSKSIGSILKKINKVVQSDDIVNDEEITWINEKNKNRLYEINKGTILCPENIDINKLKESCTYLLFENPRSAFQKLLKEFFIPKTQLSGISKNAIIAENVKIGENTYIGHNTVIEENVTIGKNVKIYHNNTILSGTVIGDNVQIGSNNTIGGIGFGYEKTENGNYEVLPHIGNVIIENNVEIGNNTCIDRAVIGSTLLKSNCKIDNLVHIAHGVIVGENSLVIAHSIIGGSTKIGKNVWIAPNSSIINKISIGDNVVVGIGAVVVKSVNSNEVVVGNPAKPLIKKNQTD